MGVDHVALSHQGSHARAMPVWKVKGCASKPLVKVPNCHEEGCWGHQLLAGKSETSLFNAHPELGQTLFPVEACVP